MRGLYEVSLSFSLQWDAFRWRDKDAMMIVIAWWIGRKGLCSSVNVRER